MHTHLQFIMHIHLQCTHLSICTHLQFTMQTHLQCTPTYNLQCTSTYSAHPLTMHTHLSIIPNYNLQCKTGDRLIRPPRLLFYLPVMIVPSWQAPTPRKLKHPIFSVILCRANKGLSAQSVTSTSTVMPYTQTQKWTNQKSPFIFNYLSPNHTKPRALHIYKYAYVYEALFQNIIHKIVIGIANSLIGYLNPF